jgi:S1-C subfamily serine protease
MITAPLLAATLLASFLPQVQGDDLERVLAAERRRVEAVERVRPAVCSVMQLDAPGGGSGVIFDRAGFVLTNFHVVGKPDVRRMKIGLPDGGIYLATVLGIDPGSDLAVLLLDPREDTAPWPHTALGDSDDLLVGQAVLAMGNPFLLATDFAPTVTWGIVSGTHRYQPGAGNRNLVYPDCIQVDTPVNPGNSGGPLFDETGAVVGINGRISVRDRGRVNVGVGFAVASNQIRNFLPDLLAGRHAEHGTLDMNAWYMRAPNDPARHGVFVQAIFADSKVGTFGVRLGDEITRFCGVEVRSANQLATMVGVLPTGTWVELGFRPQLENAGYGPEQRVEFALHTLDTGSSGDPDRRASEPHRALAAAVPMARIDTSPDADGAVPAMNAPNGREVVVRRAGERLRIDDGELALVRSADGGVAIEPAGSRELTAEESALLDRVWSTNPWLWRGAGLAARLAGALLDGGAMVGGRPAYRLALPGDGEREIWLFEDGAPAGCRYRDPVQRALVELRTDGATTQVVIDGKLAAGWRIEQPRFEVPADEIFGRPAR